MIDAILVLAKLVLEKVHVFGSIAPKVTGSL